MNRRDRVELRGLVSLLKTLKAAWVEDSKNPRVKPNPYHYGYCIGRADAYDFVIDELANRFPKGEAKR